jgi:hypothetical protein
MPLGGRARVRDARRQDDGPSGRILVPTDASQLQRQALADELTGIPCRSAILDAGASAQNGVRDDYGHPARSMQYYRDHAQMRSRQAN